MLGVALAMFVLGVALFFFFPPLGFVGASVALVLVILYLVGVGRRATQAD